MRSWLEFGGQTIEDADPADVAALVTSGIPFWLDIMHPTDGVIDRLAEVLGLHPLAVEDSKEFEQRGKLVVYGDVAMMVGFGLDLEDGLPVEVHGYMTEQFLVTFRRQPSNPIDRLHRSGSLRTLLGHDPMRPLHHLVSALHDDYPTYIDRLETELGTLEADMLNKPLDRHLIDISGLRRHADDLRRTLTPGRDVSTRATVIASLPGVTDDSQIYASDISDELRLIVADLAAISNRCLAAIGLHASLTSNRQGVASRQLAGVATVFLPITFVVGFFGMNFDVLVNDFEQGWPVFAIFGVALNMACVAVTLWWLGRRGWR